MAVTADKVIESDSVNGHLMLDASAILAGFGQLAPDQIHKSIANLFPKNASTDEKTRTVEAVLNSPLGISLRENMARWIVDSIVPVNTLVPEAYSQWRPPVRDAMIFVVSRLSSKRLAPKLIEQLELPVQTPAEVRLLRLIAKVPGLQKLGQVIARNQHLHPALRKELSRLENGIRDVRPSDVRGIIEGELGAKLARFRVKIANTILKEASVSAVVRFRWTDPESGRIQRGVFKVLKPFIREYFTEDMDYLEALADYFGDRHHNYGFAPDLIPDTFRKVRRLLQHEVNFAREQKTLLQASAQYGSIKGVRIPKVIATLCTNNVTALSEEQGVKVTNATARVPADLRRRIAEQIIEAVVAVPLFSAAHQAIFHGDPHPGNLLYNSRRQELALIDWALREKLDRETRRHLAILFLMITLRDRIGTNNEVVALSQQSGKALNRSQRKIICTAIGDFLEESTTGSSATNAIRLLERIAVQGITFPSSLIMLSKVMLTLDGILADIVGEDTDMTLAIVRRVASRWIRSRSAFRSPLSLRDWLAVQCSALLFTCRLGIQLEQAALDRLLPR